MPSSVDLAAEPAGCSGYELNRTNSGESAITLDTSKDRWIRCDNGVLLGKSTGWTNEKHRMYLDSLEASFVEQLYHSMHAGGMAMKTNSRTPFSSDMLTRLGDERQKKINCGMSEAVSDSTANSRGGFESLRFQHRSNTSKGHSVVSPDAQEHISVRNNGSHLRGKLKRLNESTRSLDHQDLVCSTEEASGQNFDDNVSRGKSLSQKSMAKRLKTVCKEPQGRQFICPEIHSYHFKNKIGPGIDSQ